MNTWFMAATTAAAIVATSGTTPLSATAASGPGGATTSAVGAAAAPAAGGTYRPIDPYRPVVADVPVTGDLRTVMPGTTATLSAYLTVPSVASGNYTITFKARSTLGATGLANTGRLADGACTIGQLRIG